MRRRSSTGPEVLGRGNNGGVVRLRRGDPRVAKWTVDPVEVAVVLAVQSLRAMGEPLTGFPEFYAIHLGKREAVIVRPDVRPPVHLARMVPPKIRTGLQSGARYLTAGRNRPGGERPAWLWFKGRRVQDEALDWEPLGKIKAGVRRIEEVYGVRALDLRPGNFVPHVGRRDRGLVVIDGGRTPVEALWVGQGEAGRRCPNESALVAAVRSALGKAPNYGQCRIETPEGLQAVMLEHGWRADEIDGTAGFHTEGKPGDILIRQGDEWSVLHELVHAAGVVDQGMATWLCEAITEATAQDIAAEQGITHHATYPREVKVLRERLVPVLQAAGYLPQEKPIFALARRVVRNPTLATKDIVQTLQKQIGGPWGRWIGALGPRSPGVEAAITAFQHIQIRARGLERREVEVKAENARRRAQLDRWGWA